MTRAGAGPGVQDAVARTIQRLRSQGWDVTSEPSPEQLPQTLADFRPDLLARRGDEHAVVEIRSRRQPPNLDLVTLAERVAALPGWRLDLVYVPEDLTVADRGQLLQWARAAEQLASSTPEAALLLGWAPTEGLLHHLAEPVGIDTDQPGALLAALASVGLLEHDEHDELRRAMEARNALAHGRQGPPVTPELVHGLVQRAYRLDERAGAPDGGADS